VLGNKRLAITTGCRDRSKNLRLALSTWVELSEPDTIIVVDFGSLIPVSEAIADFDDPRIVVVRTESPSWQNSVCHNLEFQVAKYLDQEVVLRLDNDALVQRNFFDQHQIDDRSFFAVDCHTVPAECDDKRNLCGTVFVGVESWRLSHGYNERLTQYGYEDEDFYARLGGIGLEWRQCDLDTLDHITHDDLTRISGLSSTPKLKAIFRHLPPKEASLALKEFLLCCSRQIATIRPWGSGDRMTEWNICPRDPTNTLHLVATRRPSQ